MTNLTQETRQSNPLAARSVYMPMQCSRPLKHRDLDPVLDWKKPNLTVYPLSFSIACSFRSCRTCLLSTKTPLTLDVQLYAAIRTPAEGDARA